MMNTKNENDTPLTKKMLVMQVVEYLKPFAAHDNITIRLNASLDITMHCEGTAWSLGWSDVIRTAKHKFKQIESFKGLGYNRVMRIMDAETYEINEEAGFE